MGDVSKAFRMTLGVIGAIILAVVAYQFLMAPTTVFLTQWPERDRVVWRSEYKSIAGGAEGQADCASGLLAFRGVSYAQSYAWINANDIRWRTLVRQCAESTSLPRN